jgi:hypothetical protein
MPCAVGNDLDQDGPQQKLELCCVTEAGLEDPAS